MIDYQEIIDNLETNKVIDLMCQLGADNYVEKDNYLVKTLVNIFNNKTNLNLEPIAIGGGTYAKEAKNTIAFGSCFPGKVDHIHEANEKIDLEDFYNSISIYAHAIYALGNLKDEN